MMEQHKQELLDRFDDAAFALMMDAYAEEEGARLLQEFEASPVREEMPEELDRKCRSMIQEEFTRRIRKVRRSALRIAATKAAMITLGVLALCATMAMSAEAIRVPLLRYIVTHLEQSTIIEFGDQSIEPPDTNEDDPVLSVLPKGFEKISVSNESGFFYGTYENADGWEVSLYMAPSEGSYQFGFDEKQCQKWKLGDIDAFYIRKDDTLQMIWIDEEAHAMFKFNTTGMDENTFHAICDSLAETLSVWYTEAVVQPSFGGLEEMIPPDYVEIDFDTNSYGLASAVYQNIQGDHITFEMTPIPTAPAVADLEGEAILLGEYKGKLVQEDGWQMVWDAPDLGIHFTVTATAMGQEDFILMCESIALNFVAE